MICAHCRLWDLQDSPEMAKLGFGWCRKKRAGHYTSQHFICDQNGFILLKSDLLEKRRVFFEKRKG